MVLSLNPLVGSNITICFGAVYSWVGIYTSLISPHFGFFWPNISMTTCREGQPFTMRLNLFRCFRCCYSSGYGLRWGRNIPQGLNMSGTLHPPWIFFEGKKNIIFLLSWITPSILNHMSPYLFFTMNSCLALRYWTDFIGWKWANHVFPIFGFFCTLVQTKTHPTFKPQPFQTSIMIINTIENPYIPFISPKSGYKWLNATSTPFYRLSHRACAL